MDDTTVQVLLDMSKILQPIILILLTVIGWGVKNIIGKINNFDRKLDNLRHEIHEELKEYTRKEICLSHRDYINKRIDSLMMEKCKCKYEKKESNKN